MKIILLPNILVSKINFLYRINNNFEEFAFYQFLILTLLHLLNQNFKEKLIRMKSFIQNFIFSLKNYYVNTSGVILKYF